VSNGNTVRNCEYNFAALAEPSEMRLVRNVSVCKSCVVNHLALVFSLAVAINLAAICACGAYIRCPPYNQQCVSPQDTLCLQN